MFAKVLVANRGEIAVRVIRTCREMGVRTVAVYSDADQQALHVRTADEAVRIGPPPASDSYLCLPSIVDAARRTVAEAIHPGYGFLSENPDLPDACAAAGTVFIGPPAEAMRLLADKSAARSLAAERGVPVLPGFPDDSLRGEELAGRAGEIGFPIMVKAAAGGGGRGMRLVASPEALPEALAGARREASAAFGDERLLLERAVVGGRHVEVQVLVDSHGNAVHLGERDCSVQRRHQKVIEESPSPAVTPDVRERMCAAAVELAQAAGYVNAGTVEFLLDRESNFYFLEMNTRLQVEHGVTELVSGLDLVELQLRIAAGEELPFGQHDVRLSGHAVECRVYAEDPARGYAPASGRIEYFAPPEGDGVRNDAGVEAGSDVPAEYDGLLAKLLVHAPSREEAVDRCGRALDAYVFEGPRTNLGLLQSVIANPAFASGEADLTLLETMDPSEFAPQLPDEVLLAAAAAEAVERPSPRALDPWESLGPWRSSGPRPFEYVFHGRPFAFEVERVPGGTGTWRARIDGRDHQFTASSAAEGEVIVRQNGSERRWSVARDGPRLVLESDGRRYVLGRPRRSASSTAGRGAAGSAGVLRAPMPGVIVRVLVADGQHVTVREPLVLLEAMKMEHIIESNIDGVVKAIACQAGQKVSEGDVLIEIESAEVHDDAAP